MQTAGFGDRFESKWINVDDIGNRTFTVTITYAGMAPVYSLNDDAEVDREVLYFAEAKKGLVLIQATFQTLAQTFGRNPADWVGKRLEIFVDWSIRNPSNPGKPGGVRVHVPGVAQVIPPDRDRRGRRCKRCLRAAIRMRRRRSRRDRRSLTSLAIRKTVVRDLVHQAVRSDWTSVLAAELLKTSRR